MADAFTPQQHPQGNASFIYAAECHFQTVVSCPASFSAPDFDHVMASFIANPNLTSSHLYRADVFYDSVSDVSYDSTAMQDSTVALSNFVQHMKAEYRPMLLSVQNWTPVRTIVRQLIPRNAQLDRPLTQTCHFLQHDTSQDYRLVIYLPHISSPDQSPWYHPPVKALAFAYASDSAVDAKAIISIHLSLFDTHPLTNRLERTALNLLRVVHKHSMGVMQGYVKRVHHDLIVPRKRFQDTYARLKAMHAKKLIGAWVEQTDPTKHVFEDLGIAAFLIELWRDMYELPTSSAASPAPDTNPSNPKKPPFPSFVDIGCGNGVLVHVLLREGYPGWGFDLRRRKTWSTFDDTVSSHLKELVLVPEVLTDSQPVTGAEDGQSPIVPPAPDLNQHSSTSTSRGHVSSHPGTFPNGTFIISNHADELTGWTPLLASLSQSPFIAIPCCSHDLAGARFRAPLYTKAKKTDLRTSSKPQESTSNDENMTTTKPKTTAPKIPTPSAYASLCSYLTCLTEEAGYKPEKEILRIPSTRNTVVIGRPAVRNDSDDDPQQTYMNAKRLVEGILERELNKPLEQIRQEWLERARKIAGQKGDGH